MLGSGMQDATHSRLFQPGPQPSDGLGRRNFCGGAGCQLGLPPIRFLHPGGLGFKRFKMAAHDTPEVGNAAGCLSLPQTACHQNSQRPLITTQIPSAPLVTACAITAVQSLPVRT